jgi:hypothetical protein
MRPRLVILILVIVECFMVLIMFSPSFGFTQGHVAAASRFVHNPTAENEAAYRTERNHDRAFQWTVYSVAALNPPAIIIYALRLRRQNRKG